MSCVLISIKIFFVLSYSDLCLSTQCRFTGLFYLITHTIGWDSSSRAISPAQRPRSNNTHKRHTYRQLNSNPQPQQARGRRLTSWTARPLGSAVLKSTLLNCRLLRLVKHHEHSQLIRVYSWLSQESVFWSILLCVYAHREDGFVSAETCSFESVL